MIDMLRARMATREGGRGALVTFLNPYSYRIARRHPSLFRRFDTIHYDGIVLAKLMMLAGVSVQRTSFDMTSLANSVLARAADEGRGVAFVGSEPGVPEQAAETLQAHFAGLPVVSVRHGFFDSDEQRAAHIAELVALAPAVVVVGMGVPLQERFLVDLVDAGWRGEGYTCGGFLHQTAKGGAQYYPAWMDRMNLRWLYRIYDEPKLIRRYTIDYSIFLALFAGDLAKYYWGKRSRV
ncbi:WecB/TagA/CpsF family glycosyltransferase [Franzmannia qiaohouensis]|uniref:WecB/TagA/CpsF family glycosyltransferase n=1 Tax=Franzmannia qiaohouensis TaxID=1329370 RepID=A0ABU1HJ25_9GAMM|nr:WecB/TagA/CpsF family glycosyltransferase [Halomonas qiaohouensis]MDR5907486.1 WecB/TagA/CpsF family glycosyltransferase [Halomonas qiaohouensis]